MGASGREGLDGAKEDEEEKEEEEEGRVARSWSRRRSPSSWALLTLSMLSKCVMIRVLSTVEADCPFSSPVEKSEATACTEA